MLAPSTLVEWVLDELAQARQQYGSGESVQVVDGERQPALPFLFSQMASR